MFSKLFTLIKMHTLAMTRTRPSSLISPHALPAWCRVPSEAMTIKPQGRSIRQERRRGRAAIEAGFWQALVALEAAC